MADKSYCQNCCLCESWLVEMGQKCIKSLASEPICGENWEVDVENTGLGMRVDSMDFQ